MHVLDHLTRIVKATRSALMRSTRTTGLAEGYGATALSASAAYRPEHHRTRPTPALCMSNKRSYVGHLDRSGVRLLLCTFFLSENRVRKSVVRHTLFIYHPDMLIGYARVSTDDQNLDLQRDALQRAGCERIFEEKESGRAGTKRPALEAALAFLRPEDQLVVWKVDRLGRSLREMLDTAHKLQGQGVRLRSLTEAVDTETPTGRLMFNFLGTIAEYFLDLNRERTIEGLKAAAARGRKGGRRRKLSEDDLAMARALLKDTSIPVAQIAKRLNVSRATFYAYFPQARARSLS